MERTLLLVDDEENIVSALVRLLRRDGYTILRANGGKEGLELLQQHEVGVIISDQRMPGMSGVEFLSQVKELYPDTIRIVLSGYTELNSVTDAINRGAVYKFLTKPWEDELLRANVEEAFKIFEMKRENVRLQCELHKAVEELLRVNEQLEKRLDGGTIELTRNLNLLLVSQEMLECLPLAVVGIGDNGAISAANELAHEIFGAYGSGVLLGEALAEVLPADLMSRIGTEGYTGRQGRKVRLPDGRELTYWYNRTGELSTSKGAILACAAGDIGC